MNKLFFLILIVFLLASCMEPNDDNVGGNGNDTLPTSINFFNSSSYRVDIYKNFNPEYFDITTFLCSVNPGQTLNVSVPASSDQVIGDTFYLRYKVLLANVIDTGTSNIYVDAERNLSNISFVVESGRTYTRVIPQPLSDELRFVNGYIRIQNTGSTQVQIMNGSTILQKLDDNSIYLQPGSTMGYYEITFFPFDDSRNISQLRAFSSSYLDFPEFTVERGKMFSFQISNSSVTGPVITNINPTVN